MVDIYIDTKSTKKQSNMVALKEVRVELESFLPYFKKVHKGNGGKESLVATIPFLKELLEITKILEEYINA